MQRFTRRRARRIAAFAIAAMLIILLKTPFTLAQITSPEPNETLPALQAHPLPPTLAQWHDPDQQGDYFAQVSPTRVGYLVWSAFPVKVFVEPLAEPLLGDRSQEWTEAVVRAIQEWNAYLPLELVGTSETADISIWRTVPPLQWNPANRPSGATTSPVDRVPRARSAETRYELYIDHSVSSEENRPPTTILSHRFRILLRPSQAASYLQAAARHEIGHALGIWGHSLLETDALYYSQVRNPPAISPRDVNTLKRIYEQPTRLGWTIERSPTRAPNS